MNLSVKNVPAETVERLRMRAARDHRSLQGELLHLLETALLEQPMADPDAVLAEVDRLGIRSPSESVQIIREMRDSRYGDGG